MTFAASLSGEGGPLPNNTVIVGMDAEAIGRYGSRLGGTPRWATARELRTSSHPG
jgi:hypothetical protein